MPKVPRYTRFAVAAAVVVASGLVVGTAVAGGRHPARPAASPSSSTEAPKIITGTPRSERDITNIDVLRQQIRNYYGDPLGTGVAAPDSNYAREARSVAAAGTRWLSASHEAQGRKAIVLDVDDTVLTNWSYTVFSNWSYNWQTAGTYVTGQRFTPVFGMPELLRLAQRQGYAIFYITGRHDTDEAATLGNLTADGVGVDAGLPAPTTLPDGEDGLFTKPPPMLYPDYLKTACAGDPGECTSAHYKAATRKHIESQGFDVIANFGDQASDLAGGHADRTFKMPNPNYSIS